MTETTKLVPANSSTSLSATHIERAKILAEANEDFHEVYNKVVEQLTKEELDIFDSRHKIGEMLIDMRNEEAKYGSHSIERMEKALGYDKNILYTSLIFAQRYTKQELEKLKALRNQAGQPLLWTHISHLVRVVDPEVRDELQEVSLENNLTPGELLEYIQRRQGGKKNPNAGKPMARPASIKGFIAQQQSLLEQLLKRKAKVWAGTEKAGDKSFFDVLVQTPIEKIDSFMLDEIEKLESVYSEVSIEMDNMSTELLRARKKIEKAKRVINGEDDIKPKFKGKPKLTLAVPTDGEELDLD